MSGSTSSDPSNTSSPADVDYPEQHHAGKVGLGPNYRTGPTFGDRLSGMSEELKGKITHNPDHARHGHDVFTGEQKIKDRDADDKANPFAKADDDDKQSQASPAGAAHTSGPGAKERAATVAPEDTETAETQRRGEAVDNVKHVDARDA